MTIQRDLSKIPLDHTWSFADKTIKDTAYITHGYYTYPAKFIPQLAARLITENSEKNDLVVDPFMGSGTTVVEALVQERKGAGTDINEIAYLIAKVKTTPIQPSYLEETFQTLLKDLSNFEHGYSTEQSAAAMALIPTADRIDYWFLPSQKEKLALILQRINQFTDPKIRDFYLVAFAQILKNCSIWLQKSVKPTRDPNKKVVDPFLIFRQQTKKMIKKHADFYQLLPSKYNQDIEVYRHILCGDSRQLPCADESAQLIVTSPPYVTSYEYADLHQLPSLWLGYLRELPEFRQKFIGSAYKERSLLPLQSNLAEDICKKLGNSKKGREVRHYFADLLETFQESQRVLKTGGKACIVIGNTQFKGVDILNAEVFQEQLENLGFLTKQIIHREIPSKMLPSTRDEVTGQFTKTAQTTKLAYPTEYILVMQKK